MRDKAQTLKILFVFSTVFFIFTAVLNCKNPPIFAAIEQEVKLKKASVQGIISGLVQVKEEVFTANPKSVYKKSVGDTNTWQSIGSPASMCSSLATDGNYLFAAFSNGAYYYNGEWQRVSGGERIGKVVSGNTVVGVDGANNLFEIEITVSGGAITGAQAKAKNVKVEGTLMSGAGAYFATGRGIYSSATGTKVSNSPSENIRDICAAEGNNVFVLTVSDLLHYDGTNFTNARHEVYMPWSISYLPSKKLVLVAGAKGYKEVKAAPDGTFSSYSLIEPGSEDSTTPPSCWNQYNNSVGLWLLRPILAIDRGADGYIVYAGAGGNNEKYTGLWGFYNPGQLEWNRE